MRKRVDELLGRCDAVRPGQELGLDDGSLGPIVLAFNALGFRLCC